MKKSLVSTLGAVLLAALCGCASLHTSPSDLTLEQLEAKMKRATDPLHRFAENKTYVIRQEVTTENFLDDPDEEMVEAKFEMPSKFCLTTYRENQPERIFCSNGQRGWMVECDDKKAHVLTEEELAGIQMWAKMGNPLIPFREIFPEIKVDKYEDKTGKFYRIICPESEKTPPFTFYIDAETYLLKRVEATLTVGAGKLVYQSEIIRYDRREGVLIPVESKIVQNGLKQTSKTIFFRLGLPLREKDFLPPIL